MSRPASTHEQRPLPTYTAGEVTPPQRVMSWGETLTDETYWPPHAHPTHELLWNESGISLATVGARTWAISPQLGLWIPAGVVHAGHAPSGTAYRTAHFDAHQFAARVAASGVPAASVRAAGSVGSVVPVEVSALLLLLLERLRGTLGEAERRRTERVVADVLVPAQHALVVHQPTSEVLRPVAVAITADPSDPRTLAQWAELRQLSARTLSRAFLAETGLGFSDWVAAVRAQRALVLLSSGVSVQQVAFEVGYATVNAFGTAFRRTTGITPGAVRAHSPSV